MLAKLATLGQYYLESINHSFEITIGSETYGFTIKYLVMKTCELEVVVWPPCVACVVSIKDYQIIFAIGLPLLSI
jgi:hypothetical protein